QSPAADAASSAPVLTKALLNAGRLLGLSQSEIGLVVGRERTSLRRDLDPASKSGELALLLIRAYRSLHALVGGEPAYGRHTAGTDQTHPRVESGRRIPRRDSRKNLTHSGYLGRMSRACCA